MSIYTKVAIDGGKWVEIGASSGGEPGAANFTDVPTGTYTENGVNYKYITFTGTGAVTFDVAGFADVLLVGGGGSSGVSKNQEVSGGGGAGGFLAITDAYLPSGTLTVTVGAGGSLGNNGIASRIGSYFAAGGRWD